MSAVRRSAKAVEIAPALLTLREAARYMGLSFSTLRDYVYAQRLIPSVRLGSGKHGPRRVKRADLDAFIERRTVPALRVVPGGVVAAAGFATAGKTRRAR